MKKDSKFYHNDKQILKIIDTMFGYKSIADAYMVAYALAVDIECMTGMSIEQVDTDVIKVYSMDNPSLAKTYAKFITIKKILTRYNGDSIRFNFMR